jgi:putative peptide zinc metalloprotease protein
MEQKETPNGALKVGAPAPNFRLVSAQGPEITLEGYRGQRNVILWLSRGLFCPFCRRYMTQLRLSYREIQERGAEILQVTYSTPEEARLYFQQYQLLFPYLCDPERAVYPLYGVSMIHMGAWTKAAHAAAGMTAAMSDRLFRGEKMVSPAPFKRYGSTDMEQQAVFIIDKSGIIRYVQTSGSLGGLPSNAEYLRQLDSLAQ